MFKHLHSPRRRSLNLNQTEFESNICIPHSASSGEVSSGQFQRKANRSVRIKSRVKIDGTTVVLRRGHQLSQRAKSSLLQPKGNSLFVSKQLDSPTASPKDRMKKFVQVKQMKLVPDWSTDDLCDWLKQHNLDSDGTLTSQFRAAGACGQHLAEPELAWDYMNKIKFTGESQKQDVLMRLAEALRESKAAGSPFSRSSSKSSKNNLKTRPASALSCSAESMMSSSDYVSGSSSSSMATAPSSSSDQDQQSMTSATSVSTKKMIKTISNLKNAVSKPKTASSSPKMTSQSNLSTISVYSDLQSPGDFVMTQVQVTETTTSTELIQIFLDFSSNSDDINLFTLSEATFRSSAMKGHKDRGSMKTKRTIGPEESPLAIYRSLSSSNKKQTTRRLEVSQDKGVVMKIICRVRDHKLKGKQFHISDQSTVKHVTRLALRKFRLRNVDPSLFALCDLSTPGVVVKVEDNESPQWQSGSTLLLCDRASLKHIQLDASGEKTDFKRSCSVASNLSFRSRDSSSGSDSWVPYKMDRSGRLTDELLHEESDSRISLNDADDSDVTIQDIGLLDESPLSSPFNMTSNRSGSNEYLDSEDTNTLSVENSILRAEVREKDEQMCEMSRKVAQVRRLLEGGLQQYHNDSCVHLVELNNGASLAIENELKSTEQQISSTETLLGQLFRHQRQVLAKQKRSKPTSNNKRISSNNLQSLDDAVEAGALTDIELQISLHQADLLVLKHKHHVLDMKMSLFVANRKAEKFRHMVNGSLYDIAACKRRNGRYTPHDGAQTLHACEVFASNTGYELALKDEWETKQNGTRTKGTVLECDHQQGNLKAGDRLLEVNGISVQTVGSDFVTKILRETTSARIVVARKIAGSETDRSKSDGSLLSTPEDDVDVIRNFASDKMVPGSEEMADWREMTALQSDLSMLMEELEVTSRAKRELERDLARKKNRDVVLESENARLREQVMELRKQVNYDST